MSSLSSMDFLHNWQLRNLESNNSAMKILLSSVGKQPKNAQKVSSKMDSYIPSTGCDSIYATYSNMSISLQQQITISMSQCKVPSEYMKLWDTIKKYDQILLPKHGFTVDGKLYKYEAIPKMPSEMLKDLKAENNELVIEDDVYYGIETNDGGTPTKWGLNGTSNGKIIIALSESCYALDKKIPLEELGKYASVLTNISGRGDAAGSGVYMWKGNNGRKEVRDIIDALGFKPGMCTVKVNGNVSTFYYSNDGNIYPKYHYDGLYKGYTEYDNRDKYNVGDELNINGNIYTVDEEGHVNVPYGEDLFNVISYPETKLAKTLREKQMETSKY